MYYCHIVAVPLYLQRNNTIFKRRHFSLPPQTVSVDSWQDIRELKMNILLGFSFLFFFTQMQVSACIMMYQLSYKGIRGDVSVFLMRLHMPVPELPLFLPCVCSERVPFPVWAPAVTHSSSPPFSVGPSYVRPLLHPVCALPLSSSPLSCLLSLIVLALCFPEPLHYIRAVITVYLQHLLALLRPHFNRNRLFCVTCNDKTKCKVNQ